MLSGSRRISTTQPNPILLRGPPYPRTVTAFKSFGLKVSPVLNIHLNFSVTGAWLMGGMNNPPATKGPTSLPLYLLDFIACFNNLHSSLWPSDRKEDIKAGKPPLSPFLEASAI
ncbi:hypothetical protein CEXT_494781 [Caerostris extrusa]|uniref:Uncharacterized protein n=1 Tax=Caerostris extrusa TaxID=172846 RepID=A0AAV4NBW7_CAEEX|nr:hypothetical protein CEXT_494781 [Caerostris extrusa]